MNIHMPENGKGKVLFILIGIVSVLSISAT
jgi:hypothetical protein